MNHGDFINRAYVMKPRKDNVQTASRALSGWRCWEGEVPQGRWSRPRPGNPALALPELHASPYTGHPGSGRFPEFSEPLYQTRGLWGL